MWAARLLAASVPAVGAAAGTAGPALSVDAEQNRRAISPYIYGMNFAEEGLARELALPVRRYGGNATTRYNWQNDTSNHASDWYFENLPNDNPNPAVLPDGSASDQFVEQDRRTGTKSLITVPLIGWTPKSRAVACGFSVQKYGAQQSTDYWQPDCGNGTRTNGTAITGNDPLDTSTPVTTTFTQGWIGHLAGKYGTASNGGVLFYDLDNEPFLWNSTHRDVHPAPVGYDELQSRTIQYAAAIKAADPGAQVLGPAEWGWDGYFYSALDVAAGGSWWDTRPDRKAHGDVEFAQWYLQQMRGYEQQHGVRILDYVDEHYYPQGNGVFSTNLGNSSVQALRLRSTRVLWDMSYVDESWIAAPVYLIPRMQGWVTNNYPGTKLALSEYNWGALGYLNGALAQADVLGIFGREGLDLATLWDPPTSTQPGAYAFRIYRNYDGAGGRFGETSVLAQSGNQDQLAIYAAQRSGDGALTIVVINKTGSALASTVTLAGFKGASAARVYLYSGSNLNALVRQPDLPVSGGGLPVNFPGSCLMLFVIPAAAGQSLYLPSLHK